MGYLIKNLPPPFPLCDKEEEGGVIKFLSYYQTK